MSEPLHTRSLQFHRPRLALGAFYLDECTVRAAVAASSTVPAGTEVQIAGLWPVDHPIEFLHAYFADARANGAAPEVMPGADIEIPDGLRLGDLQLSDVRLRIGPFLHPEGVLLRGSELIVSGRTVGSVTFDGWDTPPQQIEAPRPKRVVRRIVRDDSGQVVGSVEEVE